MSAQRGSRDLHLNGGWISIHPQCLHMTWFIHRQLFTDMPHTCNNEHSSWSFTFDSDTFQGDRIWVLGKMSDRLWWQKWSKRDLVVWCGFTRVSVTGTNGRANLIQTVYIQMYCEENLGEPAVLAPLLSTTRRPGVCYCCGRFTIPTTAAWMFPKCCESSCGKRLSFTEDDQGCHTKPGFQA